MEEKNKTENNLIEENPTSEQTPPVPDLPKAKPKLKFPILLLGMACLILAAATFAYFLNNNQKPKQESQTVVKVSPTPYTTTNWETYNDSNFTFSYPSTWGIYKFRLSTIPNETTSALSLPSDYVYNGVEILNPKLTSEYIRFVTFPTSVSVQDIINKIESQRKTDQIVISPSPSPSTLSLKSKTITIDKKPAQMYLSVGGYGDTWHVLVPGQNGTITEISLAAGFNDSLGATENQILSTFKFTDPNQKTTDNPVWKTYTNDAAGYSISVPSSFLRNSVDRSPDVSVFKYLDQYRNGEVVEAGFAGQGLDVEVDDKPFPANSKANKTVNIDGTTTHVSFDPLAGITAGPLKRDNLYYEIKYFETGKNFTEIPEEFNQILSTFKFTN